MRSGRVESCVQVPEDDIEAISDLPRLESLGSADADDIKARVILAT